LEGAEDDLRTAYELNSSRKVVLCLGTVLMLNNKRREAKDIFQSYSQNNLLDSEICAKLGLMCLEDGDVEEALHHFGQAIALDPKNSSVLIGLGSISQEFKDV